MKQIRILPARDYLLTPDAVWDGINPTIQTNSAVYVKDGLIRQIIPVSHLSKNEYAQAEEIRLKGITLLPGFTDCHVHLAMDSRNLWQAVEDWSNRPEAVKQRISGELLNYLKCGVLVIRDGGDMANIGLKSRNLVREDQYAGPLIVATGRAIVRKGKYGRFLGPGIDSVKEAAAQIEAFKNDGINQLKVINSGIVSFKQFGVVGAPQFTLEELKQIVAKAHAAGLQVMTHASSREAVEIAVKAGVDSVEHGYFLETRQLEMMAEYGTAWIPTLAPLGNVLAAGKPPYEGADLEVIRKTFATQLTRVKEAYDLGVNLGIGTDAGANNVAHGFSYHDELSFFTQAGLSNAAILQLAAVQSAAILGLERRVGSISTGTEPYLIGVAGNPLTSLEVLKNPLYVFMPGK